VKLNNSRSVMRT